MLQDYIFAVNVSDIPKTLHQCAERYPFYFCSSGVPQNSDSRDFFGRLLGKRTIGYERKLRPLPESGYPENLLGRVRPADGCIRESLYMLWPVHFSSTSTKNSRALPNVDTLSLDLSASCAVGGSSCSTKRQLRPPPCRVSAAEKIRSDLTVPNVAQTDSIAEVSFYSFRNGGKPFFSVSRMIFKSQALKSHAIRIS